MILDTIIEEKKTILEEELMWMPPREQGKIARQMKLHDSLFVIGEIKKASPSEGVIVEDFSTARFVNVYDETDISAISILTKRSFFQGGLENIGIARSVSDLSILRKDFIMDVREIVQTKHIGTNMTLLTVAMLDDATLREFYQLTHFLDLGCIVEVHSEKELEQVLQPWPGVIGINNHDLHTFTISLGITERPASRASADTSIVSESGIFTHEGMEYAKKAGVDVVLIGGSFMRCPDTRTYLQELRYGNCKAVQY